MKLGDIVLVPMVVREITQNERGISYRVMVANSVTEADPEIASHTKILASFTLSELQIGQCEETGEIQ